MRSLILVVTLAGAALAMTGCTSGASERVELPESYVIEVVDHGDRYRVRGRVMTYERMRDWLATELESQERARVTDTHRAVVRIRGVHGANDPQAIRLVAMCQDMGVNRVLIE